MAVGPPRTSSRRRLQRGALTRPPKMVRVGKATREQTCIVCHRVIRAGQGPNESIRDNGANEFTHTIWPVCVGGCQPCPQFRCARLASLLQISWPTIPLEQGPLPPCLPSGTLATPSLRPRRLALSSAETPVTGMVATFDRSGGTAMSAKLGSSDAESQDDLRLSVRDRLAKETFVPAPEHVWAGKGTGRVCVNCGDTISSDEVENEIAVQGGGVTIKMWAHLPCLEIWRSESKTLGENSRLSAPDSAVPPA